jgi:hypothetical protein
LPLVLIASFTSCYADYALQHFAVSWILVPNSKHLLWLGDYSTPICLQTHLSLPNCSDCASHLYSFVRSTRLGGFSSFIISEEVSVILGIVVGVATD